VAQRRFTWARIKVHRLSDHPTLGVTAFQGMGRELSRRILTWRGNFAASAAARAAFLGETVMARSPAFSRQSPVTTTSQMAPVPTTPMRMVGAVRAARVEPSLSCGTLSGWIGTGRGEPRWEASSEKARDPSADREGSRENAFLDLDPSSGSASWWVHTRSGRSAGDFRPSLSA